MQKRQGKRFKRRIQLRFWSEEDQIPKSGFTFNISLGGMFICTNSPLKPGTRVGIEIGEMDNKFQLQGIVCHSARVDPLLQQKIGPSGMGVRLLKLEEIMASLLRLSSLKAVMAEDEEEPEAEEEIEAETGVEAAQEEVVEAATSEREVYQIRYDTRQELMKAFARDLKFGGLFVPVSELPETDQIVDLEFVFGWSSAKGALIPARVVKRFAAAEGSALGEAVSGIGVSFIDPEGALETFRQLLMGLKE